MQLVLIIVLAVALSHTNACIFNESSNAYAQQRISTLGDCSSLTFGYNTNNTNITNTNITLFIFQKNEVETLSDWLQYHSYLFGFNNIVLIDNNSNNPIICQLLSLYQYCGITIFTESDFTNKHLILTNAMLEVKKKKSNSFLIPIDTDEFIVVPDIHENNNMNIVQLKTKILESFRDLKVDGRKYKFANYGVHYTKPQCKTYSNQSITSVRRVLADGLLKYPGRTLLSKTFYHSDGFISTDQGNHYGLVEHDSQSAERPNLQNMNWFYNIESNISLYHYGGGTIKSFIDKNTRGAKNYGYNASTVCKFGMPGRHYCVLAKLCYDQGNNGDDLLRLVYLKSCAGEAVVPIHPLLIGSDINSSMQYNTTNFKELFLNSMSQYDIIDWVIASNDKDN